jgi:hypothetical protein
MSLLRLGWRPLPRYAAVILHVVPKITAGMTATLRFCVLLRNGYMHDLRTLGFRSSFLAIVRRR